MSTALILPPRFWANLDAPGPNGCRLWTGRINPGGYGRFGDGTRYPTVYIHRLIWIATNGPIPDGLEVEHRCHTSDPTCVGLECMHRRCGEVSHFELLTHIENMRRQHQPTKDVCPVGHSKTGSNLYVNPRTGGRYCRECQRAYGRMWRQQPANRDRDNRRRRDSRAVTGR